ncbi:MAG: winged helix-turn-helix domain-containing protein [Candidatus Bathyarchaeia archaeon]
MEKGVGEYQIKKAQTSEKQILEILSDGKWHRYQELLAKTKLSTATLSKHLKRLEKGLIEKRLDLESGEYPYPVYYRLKPDLHFEAIKEWRDFLLKEITATKVNVPEYYIEFLNQLVGLQALENLKYYFGVTESEQIFEQLLEFQVLSVYREAIYTLREKLKASGKSYHDLEILIGEAEERMATDFERMLKAKRKDKKFLKRWEE